MISFEPKNEHVESLRLLAIAILSVSTFFWMWAIYNTYTMEKGLDLGIISFLTSMLSSLYIIYVIRKGNKIGIFGQSIVLVTHLIVAANYAFGIFFALKVVKDKILAQFAAYCVTFTFLWIGLGCYTWKSITKSMTATSVRDEEEMETLYNFT
mmetsp:Transcript_57466/g.69138  ORF Transcript_57466/g.69138 Transcript_57466/m.69138 type:complete len:153 (+) Transcript_57466:72-530(+)